MTASTIEHPAVATAKPRLAMRVRRVAGPPLFSARLFLWGGTRLEEIPGQSLVTGRLLSEGTHQRSFDRIAREAEDLGMSISTSGSTEAVGVSIDALAEDWRLALEWLAELSLEPSFPEDRLRWVTRQATAELESLADQGDFRTRRRFLRQLYHPHPYGRMAQGNAASLAGLQVSDCLAFHQRALAWGGCVTVAGDLDEEAVQQHLEHLFADVMGTAEALPQLPAAEGDGAPRQEELLPSGEQAHLYLGHLTIPRNHPDMPALEVLGVLLGAGAGLSGRLPERIREQEGLAYQVDVATLTGGGLDPGRFVVYLGTTPATAEQAERSVREELSRLLTDGIQPEELEEARAYLLGRDPFRRETAHQWADLLAEAQLYGVPVDRPEWLVEVLRGLTREEVEAAVRRWIRPQELRVTLGRPQDQRG